MAIERVSLRNDGEVTFPLNDHCPPSQSLINVEGTRPSVTLFQFATVVLGSSHQSTQKRQPHHRSQLESNQGFFQNHEILIVLTRILLEKIFLNSAKNHQNHPYTNLLFSSKNG